MAQPNQFGKQDYQKLTYSMDPRNPDALAASKSIESMVKNAIAQLQKEGAPVMHGQRRYDAGGVRNTDYYVPGQHAAVVQNAVMAAIERYEAQAERSTGISLSSASPAQFRTQTTNIMSPQTRAEVARLVKAHGGFFNTGSNGMVSWGLDKNVRVTGASGKDFNLATSLIARIGASNASHRTGWESLLQQATGNSYRYAGHNDIERGAMAQEARSIIARRAKRGVSADVEREETYAALAKSGRRYANMQRYALDNPNDPLVAKRRAAMNKLRKRSRNKKLKGAGRFAMSTIGTMIATSLALLGTGIAILSKIKDAVLSIGTDIKRQNKTDQSYNFEEGTSLIWERFASQRGIKKDLLGQAAAGVVSAWSSPLAYAESNFDKLAPYLGEGITGTLRMASADGDQNVLGIIDTVIDTLARNSQAGIAGEKSGLTKSEAFAGNLRPLSEHNAAWGELMSNYWYDAQRNGGVGNWFVDGVEMTFEKYRTQAKWNPKYEPAGGNNGVANSAIRNGAEGTTDSLNELLNTFKGFKTDVFERIFANTQQLVEDIRSLLTQWVGKYFPAFAMREQQRTIYMNRESEKLALANLPSVEAAAKSSMARNGLGGLENARKAYDAIKSGNYSKLFPGMDGKTAALRAAGLQKDKYLVPDILAYLEVTGALDRIEESRENGYNDTVIFNQSSYASAISTGTMLADLGYEKMGKELGKKVADDELYVDLKRFYGGKQSPKRLNDFIAKQEASYLAGEKGISVTNDISAYDAAETALIQQLYAYEYSSGAEKEAAAARTRLKGYYGSRGRYGKKMDSDAINARMRELDGLLGTASAAGDLASLSLAEKSANQIRSGDAVSLAYENMAQVNAGLSGIGYGDINNLIGKQLQFTPNGAPGAGGDTVVNLVQYVDINGKQVQVLNKRVATIRNSGLKKPETIYITGDSNLAGGLTDALNKQMKDN